MEKKLSSSPASLPLTVTCDPTRALYACEVEITSPLGLHARPAAAFVKLSNHYESDVWLSRPGMRVNGKSIMGVLMLAAPKGTMILIETIGRDAEEAVHALSQLVLRNFDPS